MQTKTNATMYMRLPETEIEFRNALIDAAEVGAAKALIEVGALKPYFKLSEAYRIYGSGIVKRWIKEGLITPIKDGDKNANIRIDRIQILTLAKTCNRASYFSKKED